MVVNYKRLNVHHIGGRFGDGGFPVIDAFEKDVVRVLYDADSDCIEQIKERHKKSKSELHVFPYCIGENNQTGTFNINYDPTSSSIYSFNPDYSSFYFFLYNHDFIVSDSLRTMEKREVEFVSIDKLYKTNSSQLAFPDFLSMDVQGAEYAILQGAKDTLKKNVLALVIETGLHPIYHGQKIFGDINSFLSEMGFYFVKFLRFQEYSPLRAPVGLRGNGFQSVTDVLFLRKIEDIKNAVSDELLLYIMLRKLAFISIIYNQFEYGLECLKRSRKMNESYAEELKGLNYYEFLKEIEKNIEKMSVRYPKTFSEKYTFELSKKRFYSQRAVEKNQNRTLREKLWLKVVYPNIYTIARIYEFLIQGVWAKIAPVIFINTPVEKVLLRYGLRKQARLIKRNRVIQFFFSH